MADTRLEAQRRSRRLHQRANSRWYVRGYTTVPHPPWGDVGGSANPPPIVVATGVTAGSPGSFTPAGATPPANLTAINLRGALGQTVAWTTGQYVILGDGSNAYWNGTAWAEGMAAASETDVHATNPGNFTIAEIQAWVDDHPEAADEVLAAEMLRASPRVTLVDWLEGFISHRDEGTVP